MDRARSAVAVPAIAALAAVGLLFAPPVSAQRAAPAPAYDSTLFAGLEWRNIGPERGGRSIAVAGSTARPNEYWFGATGGGLWKSQDGGQSWRPVSDEHFRSSSVGAIGVCEKDPDVVYVGMGEVQLRGNVMQGDGVYRTTDGGRSWTHVGLEETHAIGRVRVHPDDCDVVYVAALGHPYGPNEERGAFRSTDGGTTWKKVLYVSDRAGAVDLSVDPANPDRLYAGTWEVHRTSWTLSSGGEGSGLWKSVDGGETWTSLRENPGLPGGIWGKVGVSVSGADPLRVYAIIEAEEGGVFRSDDAGATWERVNDERRLRQRAFYYTRVYADPRDRDRVYVLNTGFYRSTDGGKTYRPIRVPHGDNHDLWIAPDDPDRMINANDGGANVSVNGGRSWTEQDFPTAQMYHVITTHHEPYHVCGAQQDNSTACVPYEGWGHLSARGPNHGYYYAVGGGESGYIAPDPEDPNVFYAGSYGGNLTRYDHRTGQERDIRVWPENPMGHSAEDIRERFQWTFPIVFSRTDPNVLYVASQHLWKTTNEGQSWERISPDLTRHDPMTMGPSGGPITRDQTGVETYATIFTVAPSYHDGNTIWVGSDDGLVHISRDGGANWQDITPPDLPRFARVSLIEASPHRPGKAYLAANRYQLDDRGVYLYRTEDYGATWTKITAGIPDGHFARAVREDPTREGLLFAGTEHGVYVSFDDGARWQPLRLGLPDVQVPDLVVEDEDLVIATHGRSFYVMDDIAPLRQLTPDVARADVHLYAPSPATRSVEPGASIYYYLKEGAEKVVLEILDGAGNVIRSYTGTPQDTVRRDDDDGASSFRGREPKPPIKAGLHRFTWDLRHEGPEGFPGMILWAAGLRGPRAVPGSYRVRLTVDDRRPLEQPLEVRMDPRLQGVTLADLQAQFDLAARIRDRTDDANGAVRLIRGVRKQADERAKAASDSAVTALAEALSERLSAVEGEIYQVRNRSNQDPLNFPIKLNNKIAALQGVVESADARPTDQSYTVFEELSARLQAELDRMERLLAEDLPRLNALLAEKGLPPVERTPIPAEEPEERAVAAGEEGEG